MGERVLLIGKNLLCLGSRILFGATEGNRGKHRSALPRERNFDLSIGTLITHRLYSRPNVVSEFTRVSQKVTVPILF